MVQTDCVHVGHTELSADGAIPGYIEHEDADPAPLSVAVPLIAGLSGALWAVLWFAGRSLAGLWASTG